MGPNGHPAGRLAAHRMELRQPGEHLNAEPVEQHDPGRNAEDLEEDQEPEEHVDPDAREEHQVRAHHAGDRSRGSHGRHGRRRVHHDLRGRGGEAAQQVEAQEAHGSHHVFDGAAEDPEEERVAEDVHPAAVQEEREQRRDQVDAVAVHRAVEARADRHRRAERREVRDLAGDHAVVADRRGEQRGRCRGTRRPGRGSRRRRSPRG